MMWELYAQSSHMSQRVGLWQAVKKETGARTVLYPGSYVDVSPSFLFDQVTYVDTDRRCPKFFADAEVQSRTPSSFSFLNEDYRKLEGLEPADLLISLYAGPISHFCKKFLRIGGHLLVNNSHADAGVAALDPDFELVGAFRGDRLSKANLDAYFHPKGNQKPDRDELISSMKGIGYSKTAPCYLFERMS